MFDLAPGTTVERFLILSRCYVRPSIDLHRIWAQDFRPRVEDMQRTVQECGLRSGWTFEIEDGTED